MPVMGAPAGARLAALRPARQTTIPTTENQIQEIHLRYFCF
jgi:hypothetical protein